MLDPTNPSPPITAAPPAKRRPWWRLHVSTWIVMGLAGALLMLMNAPARTEFYTDWITHGDWKYEHGWPTTYMVRKDEKGTIWSWDNVWEFRPWGLVADVLIGVGMIASVGAAKEFFRRRRRGPWQFSLRTALLVLTLAACAAGWLTHRYRCERAAAQHIEALSGTVHWANSTPAWLDDLVGQPCVEPFCRVRAVGLGAVNLEACLDDLTQFYSLEDLGLSGMLDGTGGFHSFTFSGAADLDAKQAELDNSHCRPYLPVLRMLADRSTARVRFYYTDD